MDLLHHRGCFKTVCHDKHLNCVLAHSLQRSKSSSPSPLLSEIIAIAYPLQYRTSKKNSIPSLKSLFLLQYLSLHDLRGSSLSFHVIALLSYALSSLTDRNLHSVLIHSLHGSLHSFIPGLPFADGKTFPWIYKITPSAVQLSTSS